MSKSKAKPVVWCSCEAPRPLLDGEGRPFVPEPLCQCCGYAVKRRPPGAIQSTSPGPSWTHTGPCPRPPELDTSAARRGIRQARRGRQQAIAELDEILQRPEELSAPQRVAFEMGLGRYLAAEALEPPPPARAPARRPFQGA